MNLFGSSKQMTTDEKVNETVTDWLNILAANFQEEEIIKLVQHLASV
jgi:DNA-binding transcriptional regulator GbsR (MarR family)